MAQGLSVKALHLPVRLPVVLMISTEGIGSIPETVGTVTVLNESFLSMESSGVRHLSIKSSACVCLQGDYVWLEPENQGEFDVAIGAQVKAVGGGQIHLQDDDNKVSKIRLPSINFENHYHKETPPLNFQ